MRHLFQPLAELFECHRLRSTGQPLYVYQWQPCNTTLTTQCYVVFNKAAFATFPSGTFGFGNVGRDFLRSPGTFNIDAAI